MSFQGFIFFDFIVSIVYFPLILLTEIKLTS